MNKKPVLLILLILILLPIFTGCPEEEENDLAPDIKIGAYIRTWSIPQSAREPGSAHWNAGMIKGEYLSDLIIAFALIDKKDGCSIYVPDTAYTFSNMWDEVAALKAKYPRLNVNISVGGANEAGFSGMAADTNKRAAFIANVCDWLDGYNLDGVDIDWEYPVRPLTGGGPLNQDKETYILLLQELRGALDALGEKNGKRYGLSTAVPANNTFTRDIDVKKAAEFIDSFKLMAYDYYGSWSGTTGHNANLYRSSYGGSWSTNDAVNVYLNAGVPPEKITLGAAFYGRSWDGVKPGTNTDAPGLFRSGPFTGTSTYEWIDINRYILQSSTDYIRYWDNAAKAPFLYNGSRWISYTDQEQLKAIKRYVKEKKLAGVFVWEYSQDMKADLLRILADSSQ